jgi:hypothetical protein
MPVAVFDEARLGEGADELARDGGGGRSGRACHGSAASAPGRWELRAEAVELAKEPRVHRAQPALGLSQRGSQPIRSQSQVTSG